MKQPRSTYVHRGDAIRRRARWRNFVAFVGITGAAALVIANRKPAPATAEAAAVSSHTSSFSFSLLGENRRLRRELDNASGETAILRAQMERANRVMTFSTRYGIPANLSAMVFDVALAERLDPELAFRLVKLE